jgi:L-gulonolactone oxidase
MGDIDRQQIAGAIATGTHGSGMRWGSLSSLVAGATLVDGRGRIQRISEADVAELAAVRVGLGALGVMASIDLQIVPAYHLEVKRWGTTFEKIIGEMPQHIADNRTFEFFWFPGTPVVSARRMNDAPAGPSSTNSVARFVNELVVENGIGWLGSVAVNVAPRARRLMEVALGPILVAEETSVRPAYDAFATPRLVRHFEMEYALPIEHAAAVLRELDAMLRRHPVTTVFPVEVRFTPREDAHLSPAQGRDTVWIAVHTWVREDFSDYFDRAEAIFLAAGGRPHWGKLHSLTAAELAPKYPGWERFQAVRRRFDPDGRFTSPYLERLIGRC